MNPVKYKKLDEVDPDEFIHVLNQESLRAHLIPHNHFDSTSIRKWVKEKIHQDSLQGCRVRAVYINETLAGWCGIQKDNDSYEIAIVIAKSFWGAGPMIFKDLISWSREFNHREVLIHLLETRKEYKFLKRLSTSTHKTKMLGKIFITYRLSVNSI